MSNKKRATIIRLFASFEGKILKYMNFEKDHRHEINKKGLYYVSFSKWFNFERIFTEIFKSFKRLE